MHNVLYVCTYEWNGTYCDQWGLFLASLKSQKYTPTHTHIHGRCHTLAAPNRSRLVGPSLCSVTVWLFEGNLAVKQSRGKAKKWQPSEVRQKTMKKEILLHLLKNKQLWGSFCPLLWSVFFVYCGSLMLVLFFDKLLAGEQSAGLHAVYLMGWLWAAGQDDRAEGEGCTDCLTEMKDNWILASWTIPFKHLNACILCYLW